MKNDSITHGVRPVLTGGADTRKSMPGWWVINGWRSQGAEAGSHARLDTSSSGDFAGPEITLPSVVNREP